MNELEYPFSLPYQNPWDKQHEEILMGESENDVITDENKVCYLFSADKIGSKTNILNICRQ